VSEHADVQSGSAEQVDVDEVVGGDIEAADEPLPTYDPRPLREQVAKSLAVAFAIGLGFSFLLHYVSTVILAATGHIEAVQAVKSVFDVWLPVISSLTSAAATFYFTKER
jgi:hypothetical protein